MKVGQRPLRRTSKFVGNGSCCHNFSLRPFKFFRICFSLLNYRCDWSRSSGFAQLNCADHCFARPDYRVLFLACFTCACFALPNLWPCHQNLIPRHLFRHSDFWSAFRPERVVWSFSLSTKRFDEISSICKQTKWNIVVSCNTQWTQQLEYRFAIPDILVLINMCELGHTISKIVESLNLPKGAHELQARQLVSTRRTLQRYFAAASTLNLMLRTSF